MITAQELFDFAITSGDLYARHCVLAHQTAAPGWELRHQPWYDHVADMVLPLYRREVLRLPASKRPIEDTELGACDKAAGDLRTYYEQHIQEG